MVKSEGILTGLSRVKTAKSVIIVSGPNIFSPIPFSITGIDMAREAWTSSEREIDFISESLDCIA